MPSTLEWRRAVKTLKRLPDEHDQRLRAYAESAWEAERDGFLAARGLRISQAHPCIARLLGRRCWQTGAANRRQEDAPCLPPGCDHPVLLNRNGKPWGFLCQPYDLDKETLRELVAFCDRWELGFTIRAGPAWHFPGGVIGVLIRREGSGVGVGGVKS